MVSEDVRNKYDLPEDLAQIANSCLKKSIQEKELKALILLEQPVPNNVEQIPRVDDKNQI